MVDLISFGLTVQWDVSCFIIIIIHVWIVLTSFEIKDYLGNVGFDCDLQIILPNDFAQFPFYFYFYFFNLLCFIFLFYLL